MKKELKKDNFKVGIVEYPVLHNLEEFGLDFNKTMEGFFLTRKIANVTNFCKYVVNRGDGNLICIKGL